MLTDELRSQVDDIWNALWSGGISNSIEVMEQITYLLFIRRLDDAHTLEEGKVPTAGWINAPIKETTAKKQTESSTVNS